ncbi:formate dehydrogenase accessory protein FdhE [Comamonas sp. SCN 65-56]|uniref:formate dehydrogenase accessory protein FdhE n=1 Tax=Comamonas sp. SCN 65-56 TaxID=1660095 RepID=UPI000AFDD067|nr:formate dehydrogenase accessory protein FdhE [Comamonas sp. SCN 65-56]
MNSPEYQPFQHTPEEIALRSSLDVPLLLLPKRGSVFADRALRLRQKAADHAMRDYLMFMAVVCEAQHARLPQFPQVPIPTQAQIDAAAHEGTALLATDRWPRDPAWRGELRALLAQVLQKLPADSPARAGVQAVMDISDDMLEQQADRLLAGITLGLDLAAAPLIAAGLQLYWVHLVTSTSQLGPTVFRPRENSNRCPCCNSAPTASLTRVGGKQEGQRYLCCSLCGTQWLMERVQCTHCLSDKSVRYRGLQPADAVADPEKAPAIEAETCDACKHYLKTMHMAREVHVEPVADDLASLTLDLLVSEEGYIRSGTNLLLLFGDPEAEPEGA